MRKWPVVCAVVVLAVVSCRVAVAEGLGLTAKAGTLGFGGDLSVGIFDQVNARIGINYLNLNITREDVASEVKEISVALDLQTIAALLDWHPGGMGFRISAGGMLNNNKLALSAVPNETVQVNDVDFTVSSLDGELTFKDFAPYLGIGYGNAGKTDKDTHWRFSFDLGVLFQGEPTVNLSATAQNPALQPALNSAIEEEKKKQEDKIAAFKVYPVLSFGVSYVF